MAVRGLLRIAVVGKLRQAHWRSAQDIYVERLTRYTTLDVVEVKDWVGQGLPDARAAEKEGEALLQVSASARNRIALTPAGKSFTTPGLAQFLEKQIETFGSLAFFIGGPVGLSSAVLKACPTSLSLSPLTFPHELARVIWLEQLYRSFTILAGEKYHK
ncbi:MAG: 23S rRNA (pseudouridine(1915)-N(3))-methyltransferase RlmH [Elusimicrobiota bacterium]|jgi:23S rRNA (pseudouridine1915-N3)-methyltransferase